MSILCESESFKKISLSLFCVYLDLVLRFPLILLDNPNISIIRIIMYLAEGRSLFQHGAQIVPIHVVPV